MSHNTSNVQSQNSSNVYERLYRVYNNVAQLDAPIQLNQLPESVRNQIYGQVYELANRPQTNDAEWGRNNAFRNFQRLQTAIQRVALNMFRAMPTEQRNPVAERIWILGGRQQGDSNWGENHAGDNADHLFRSLIGSTNPSALLPRSTTTRLPSSTPPTTPQAQTSRPTPSTTPQAQIPRPSTTEQRNRFSDEDYVDDHGLDAIISSLSVPETSAPSSTSTSTTEPRSRATPFNWGPVNTSPLPTLSSLFPTFSSLSLPLPTPPTQVQPTHRVTNRELQSMISQLGGLRVSQLGLSIPQPSTSSTPQPSQPPTQPVTRDQPRGFSNDDYQSDEDFERILRMLSEAEAHTSSPSSTTTSVTTPPVATSTTVASVADPVIERKMAAIFRLNEILSLGDRCMNSFEPNAAILTFDLDAVLAPYAENHAPSRLCELLGWAGIGDNKRQRFSDAIRNYDGHHGGEQDRMVRILFSKMYAYFEQRRTQGGQAQDELLEQFKGVVDKIIDANANCVDQMLSQLQDMMLDLAADSFTATQGGDRLLQRLQFRAGHALAVYRANLLKAICVRQNPNQLHMADLERVIMERVSEMLGMRGRIYDAGARFGGILGNVDDRVANAIDAFQHEYKPLQFLASELKTPFSQLRKLRTDFIQWADQNYALGDEEEDEVKEHDMNRLLSLDYDSGMTGPFNYGGDWTPVATLFLMEAAGLIRQAGQL